MKTLDKLDLVKITPELKSYLTKNNFSKGFVSDYGIVELLDETIIGIRINGCDDLITYDLTQDALSDVISSTIKYIKPYYIEIKELNEMCIIKDLYIDEWCGDYTICDLNYGLFYFSFNTMTYTINKNIEEDFSYFLNILKINGFIESENYNIFDDNIIPCFIKEYDFYKRAPIN